jgi:hypothetical protein
MMTAARVAAQRMNAAPGTIAATTDPAAIEDAAANPVVDDHTAHDTHDGRATPRIVSRMNGTANKMVHTAPR